MQEGDNVGPYTLCEQVGSGGMGVVHRAETANGTSVAIKMLHPGIATAESRDRLAREVESQRRIRHANVAEVLDADTDCDRPYIVTEFINGPTLEARVKQDGALTRGELAVLGRGLGEALDEAHKAEVVHRDVKPTNILLQNGSPILIDFGISHVADSSRITQHGLVMGTPGYLAPEVISHAELTPATDWWGWAATMVYGATGEHPFGSGSYQEVMGRIYAEQPILQGVPGELRDVLRRSLAVTIASRPEPPDLRVVIDALQSAADAESGVPTTKLAHGPVAEYVHLMSGRDAPPPATPGAAADRLIPDPNLNQDASDPTCPQDRVKDRRLPHQVDQPPTAPSDVAVSEAQPQNQPAPTPHVPVRPSNHNVGPAARSWEEPASDHSEGEPPNGSTEVLDARRFSAGESTEVLSPPDRAGGDATEVLDAKRGSDAQPAPKAPPARGDFGSRSGSTKIMPSPYTVPAKDQDSGEGVTHVRPIIEDLAPPSDPADLAPVQNKRQQTWQKQQAMMKGWTRQSLMEPGRRIILTTWGAVLVIIGALSPFALLTVGLLWAGAALTASASARALIRRHQEFGGPRSSDVPVLVVGASWRFAASLLRLLLPLSLALLVGVVAGTTVALVVEQIMAHKGVLFGAMAMSTVAMLVMWSGPVGPDLRYGSRAIARNITGQLTPAVLTMAVLLLAVLSGMLVMSSPNATPDWGFLGKPPWDYFFGVLS